MDIFIWRSPLLILSFKQILSLCYTYRMPWWVLKRKIHISWLITIFCGFLSIGVCLALYLNNFSSPIYLAISLLLILIGVWRQRLYIIPLIIIAGLSFGLWRGSLSQADLVKFEPFYGQTIKLSGLVKDDADVDSSGKMSINLNDLRVDESKMAGIIRVTVDEFDIKRGDVVKVDGKLQKGFGNYAGSIYEAKVSEIVRPEPGDIAREVRDWFAEAVKKAIDEPESSLGLGYLLGQRKALPADLVIALQAVGLTHIVVASGYNLTVLVRFARRLFIKISKYLATLSAMIMIVAFVMVTGLSPSMSRAGFVAAISLLAWYYGRKFHPITLLALAMAVTLIFNPSYGWGDIGWQLSFAAFGGVMIVSPLAQRYLFGDKKPGFVGQVLSETISAQLTTAPVLIMAFGQISNISVLSNLMVLPLVPLTMLLTFIAGIGGLILPSFAKIIGLPASWLLRYMIEVIKKFADLPWAVSAMKIEIWPVLIYYLVLIGFCIFMSWSTKYKLRDTNLVE